MNLNDLILALVQEHGLAAVAKALVVTCYRQAEFASDACDDHDNAETKAWNTDAATLERVVPLLINE